MSTDFTTEEIKQKYDESASKYALMERVQEFIGVRRLRRRLLRRVSGTVLEVACGTGANFPYYPDGCEITAVDVSPEMMDIAKQRAEKLGLDIDFQLMDAETLAFPDEHFDTVVSTLTVCTYPDPIAALCEMERVCREGGRVLLLEHGRSDNRLVGRFQDVREQAHAKQLGCHWNREPLELVEQAGLCPIATRRTFLGIFHEIEAK
ncbi:class I SAM-dependent methyltransferase [Saliphagus infecundisoli]|uniref:Class I SAM-dependent methyltransferase n=1 Tax=Saliphagus infecundisoli TaxID=1849069 RepID=A0ABD5QHQ4_9EURY|nr:class I SAM-dependent methyltransferase [Saliphagus infecundisoli]